MTSPRLSVVAATAAGATLLLTGPAHAQDYTFPDSCAGVDIAQFDPECTTNAITVTVDAEGTVEWARDSAYPRNAFDEFMTDIDGYVGTTEEYLDGAKEDVEQETGASLAYEATDSTVIVTIAMTMGIDSAEAGALGVTSDGDTITVSLNPGAVADANSVEVVVPGRMLESNGTIDGSSATWTGGAMEGTAALSATGEAEPAVATTRWIVAGAVLAVIAVLIALYLVVWRRRPDGTYDPIDLEPEYTSESDADHGDNDNDGQGHKPGDDAVGDDGNTSNS